jgi:hypothetical protein
VKHGCSAFDIAQSLYSLSNTSGRSIPATDAFFSQPDALATHFEPFCDDFDRMFAARRPCE